jgi:hypothetical protein
MVSFFYLNNVTTTKIEESVHVNYLLNLFFFNDNITQGMILRYWKKKL